jgi:UDP-2-acetamido-3-amino-2,3-dideoxy-glucuronate N-acetyltransferase
MSRHGHRLARPDPEGVMRCPESGLRYRETSFGTLRCLDLDEDEAMPAELTKGTLSYRQLKRSNEPS